MCFSFALIHFLLISNTFPTTLQLSYLSALLLLLSWPDPVCCHGQTFFFCSGLFQMPLVLLSLVSTIKAFHLHHGAVIPSVYIRTELSFSERRTCSFNGWATSPIPILFLILAAPFHILINSIQHSNSYTFYPLTVISTVIPFLFYSYGHPNGCEVSSLCCFAFHFPRSLMIWNICSCIYPPVVYLLWNPVYWNPLHVFKSTSFLFILMTFPT